MTSFQKIIKYGAIAFAIYLSLVIVGAIVFSITVIFGISSGFEMFQDSNHFAMVTKWEQEFSDITSMDIEAGICKLMIKKGDTFKVEVSNVSDQFRCEAKGSKLIIEDEKLNRNIFGINNIVPEVIIYVPENSQLDEVRIETGVNDTHIESLKADKVELEMGIGKYQIDNLSAKYAQIEAGAGETNINKAEIGELKLNGGVGKLVLTSKITKTADVDCGVGKVDLNLMGTSDDYQIEANTGLGNFEVDGKKVRDDERIGSGAVTIKIEAGVGETTVNFIEF